MNCWTSKDLLSVPNYEGINYNLCLFESVSRTNDGKREGPCPAVGYLTGYKNMSLSNELYKHLSVEMIEKS